MVFQIMDEGNQIILFLKYSELLLTKINKYFIILVITLEFSSIIFESSSYY